MRKIVSTALLIVLMVYNFILPSFAASDSLMMPLWDNTTAIYAQLDFSGTRGTLSAYVVGDADVTDIIAFADLYYKDANGKWVEIEMPWGFISTSTTLEVDEDFNATRGVEYKVEFTAYVYVDYDEEEVTYTAYGTCR